MHSIVPSAMRFDVPARALRAMVIALAFAASGTLAEAGPRERAITDALIWTGMSERVARSRLDAGDRRAIVRFERRIGGRADGRLGPREEAILLERAEARRRQEGYRIRLDRATGVELGLPRAWLAPPQATREGTRWSSPDGAITVETFRTDASLAVRRAVERRRSRVTYDTGGRNWFVLSGYRDGRPFYVRAEARGGEVRGVSVQYDDALRDRLDRVVVAMSSDLRPFAGRPHATDSLADADLAPAEPLYAALPRSGPAPGDRPVRRFAALERERDFAVRRETLPPLEAPGEATREADAVNDDAPARQADPAPSSADPIPPLAEEFGPLFPDTGTSDPALATSEAPPAGEASDPAGPSPQRRAGLQPLSGEPVAASGEETEEAVPREITGLLTDEGQSCPTLRGSDGALYALVGEVPSVEPGTVVTIEAVEVVSERCSAGRTVAVGAFRVRELR